MSSRPPLLPWSKPTWDRWSSMPRMSSGPIPRTKFLLLKAPVSTLYEERFGGDRNMFTVSMYGGRMMAKGVRVGAAVDCTSLDLIAFDAPPDGKAVRYFHDTNEWDDYDIEYHSLAPPPSKGSNCTAVSPDGGSAVPPQSAVDNFLSICSTHWKNHPNEHISLFDSRGGIGAASYLATLYMCEKMRAPVHVALASVREVMKPCGLSDAVLVRDLQRRYKGRREVKIYNIPGWWFAVEDDDEDDDEEKVDDGGKDKKRDRDIAIVIPPFDKLDGGNGACSSAGDESMGPPARKRPRPGDVSSASSAAVATSAQPRHEIPGLQLQPRGSSKYKRAISVLGQLMGKPCTSGVPFSSHTKLSTADDLQSKLTPGRRYKVTWRSRGRRGLLLILTEGAYFLEDSADDTGVDVSTVSEMRFPHPTDQNRTQHRTLLDGVLVTDREGPHNVPRYYATDILCHMGAPLVSKPFGHRIKFLIDGVIMARKKDAGHNYGREPVKIRANEYFGADRLEFVLKDVLRGVAHETGGMMIIPVEGQYYSGGGDGDAVVLWGAGGVVSEADLVKHFSALK